jgi:hypothetical protein
MPKLPEQTAESRLLAALDELDDAKLAAAIAVIDQQIDALTAPLRKRRKQLQRCRMILRGKQVVVKGIGCKRAATPEKPPVVPPPAGLSPFAQATLAALGKGHITARAIALQMDDTTAPVVLAMLNELEKAGKVERGPVGSATWKLARTPVA